MRLCSASVVAVVAILLVTGGPVAQAQSTWDRYQPRELREIIEAHAGEFDDNLARVDSTIAVSADDFPSRAWLEYTGLERPFAPDRKSVFRRWLRSMGRDTSRAALYEIEWLFREGEREFWLPMPNEVLSWGRENVQPGERVEVFVLWLGVVTVGGKADWLFIATAL